MSARSIVERDLRERRLNAGAAQLAALNFHGERITDKRVELRAKGFEWTADWNPQKELCGDIQPPDELRLPTGVLVFNGEGQVEAEMTTLKLGRYWADEEKKKIVALYRPVESPQAGLNIVA